MSTVYTEELVSKIKAAGAFTFASACAFAESEGLKPKSLIAKIVQLGMPYEAKPKPVPKKVENDLPKKADVLASIFAKIETELPSMERMTVSELMVLDASLFVPEAEDETEAEETEA